MCLWLMCLTGSIGVFAQQTEPDKKVTNPIGVAADQAKSGRQTKPTQITIITQIEPGNAQEVTFSSDKQEAIGEKGEIVVMTGNAQITYGDVLVIADRATYNKNTDDLLAEG
ncbi:MAG: hypothetical protein AAB401_23815, partial [Acidobacteriota bacterium]